MAHPGLPVGVRCQYTDRSAALAGWGPRAASTCPPSPALNMPGLALSTRRARPPAIPRRHAPADPRGGSRGGEARVHGADRRLPAAGALGGTALPYYYCTTVLLYYCTTVLLYSHGRTAARPRTAAPQRPRSGPTAAPQRPRSGCATARPRDRATVQTTILLYYFTTILLDD